MSAAAEPWFPSLRHHWLVLKHSWARDAELASKRRTVDETQFLPAALEIVHTPASPGLRALLLTLCGLFAVAIAWACIGQLDVVAVATGKVMPIANVKVIQPLEIGFVRAIHVREGQRVRAGELLVELDPTITGADEAQATRGLLAARVNRSRSQALLAYLQGRPASFVAPPGAGSDVRLAQQQLIRSAIAEYEAKRSGLLQQRAQRQAELVSAEEEERKQRETLPILDKQIEARRILTEKGLNPKILLWQLEETRIERVQNIKIQASSALRARAAISTIDAQLVELRETFGKDAATEFSQSGDDTSLRTEELTKSARRKVYQRLRAPVDGTIQQLAIHTVGGVVQPAQTLMVLVPSGSGLAVDVAVLNKDIGFVREGQTVRLKVDAYPFTEYGLIQGRVERISRDAIQDEKLGLVYSARVRMLDELKGHGGGSLSLSPGMSVQAEIKTAQRRIIQYLLSPIARAADEAGRER